MPPAKSRNVLPSTSVSVAPEARSTKIGTTSVLAFATTASLRAIHAREIGPGISVWIRIDCSTVLLLLARERPCTVRPSPGTARTLWSHRTIRRDGALGQIDPRGGRGRPHRPRPLRPRARAAVERRRALRPPLPRLPPGALPVHRRARADARPHRARRDRRGPALHPAPRRVRARARRSRCCGCRTTSWRVSTARARSGRLGLQVHSTAGLADPGFEGQITLELSNVASLPIAIYPGMRIAQLVFERLTTPADKPYGARRSRLEVPGPARPDGERVLAQLRSS